MCIAEESVESASDKIFINFTFAFNGGFFSAALFSTIRVNAEMVYVCACARRLTNDIAHSNKKKIDIRSDKHI